MKREKKLTVKKYFADYEQFAGIGFIFEDRLI